MTENRFDELDSLLFDWHEGTLDDSGVEKLRKLLRNDEQAQAYYVRLQMMDSALRADAAAGLIAAPDTVLPSASQTGDSRSALNVNQTINEPQSSLRIRTSTRWLLATAAVVILIQAALLIRIEFGARSPDSSVTLPEEFRKSDKPVEPTSQGVAVITRLVDVEWGENQPTLDIGDALQPGRLAIDSGFAQVEFFCGATVILEGPAELDLQSSLLARVRRGRLRAQVPPAARGFSLEVDDMTVVDLGTEFGLSVTDQGANVQVFDGEVELQQPASEKRLLKAGQSLTRASDGSLQRSDITPEDFVGTSALEAQAMGQQTARYQRWKQSSDRWRRDPRVIAYYTFENQDRWNRRLSSSVIPTNTELDGAIVGARKLKGRWTTKSALEFKQPGDRVRIQIPGEHRSLTLSCWVRIDSLDRWYNSLFLTDGYNYGEPHWQILDTGQLFFSVRSKPDVLPDHWKRGTPSHQVVLSPPFWKPSMSGKWLHLATTYDVNQKRTTHYLNGERLHSEVIPDELLVETTRIGAASIGNWSLPTRPDATFAIRNLNGRMDEFAMFAAALSADEIREIYEDGKP